MAEKKKTPAKSTAKKSSSKKQTVGEFIEELGAEMKINSTVSTKLLSAVVTKKFKPFSVGFDTHGMKVNSARVPVWIKAKRDEKEYLILFYQPKPEGKKQKPTKTYYKLITEAAEA